MKNLKLLVAAYAAATMALSAFGAAERVKAKLLNESSDPVRGYWVEYEINGMKFRSDQTGSRINEIAWNAMNATDKERTINAVYSFDIRRLQFGDAGARKMGEWFDLRKGWKQAKGIFVEKLIEKDFPGLTARFMNSGAYAYYLDNFRPECPITLREPRYYYAGDCPDQPEMDAQIELSRYFVCDLAASAYTALEKAEYLRTAAAVKSTAGDLIQLICDKCLIPAVSPGINGGIGLFSMPDALGTGIDYFNNLVKWQSWLEESVIGKRASSSDAAYVIQHMTSAINASYRLIRDCTVRAHELQNAVVARHEEWVAAREARRAMVDSDALVLKYRECREAGKPIPSRYEATATISNRIAELKQEIEARQREYYNARREAEAAALAALNAASKALDDHLDGLAATISARANAWKATRDAKIAALQASAAQRQAPAYPGVGTAWNGGRLYDAMAGYTATADDAARAARELNDYADKMEAYYFFRRDLGEETLALADELVASGQPIFNDAHTASVASSRWRDYGTSDISSFEPRTIPGTFAITEDDLFYRVDPAFMEDVRKARSSARLCANYVVVLETRQRYENVRGALREKVEKGVIAAKVAYNAATNAYAKAKADIPAYVKEQRYEFGVYYDAGRYLDTTEVDTELRRKFVDATGTADLAAGYRNELNENVAGFTAKLLAREDAYGEQFYQRAVLQCLGGSDVDSGWQGVDSYGRYQIDSGEDFEKMRDLQEDFNGHLYSHRVMICALGELDRRQEIFVEKSGERMEGEGSDTAINELERASHAYSASTKPYFNEAVAQVRTAAAKVSQLDSMGTGSYAYHVPNYFENMGLPVKNPHKALVAPLVAEIRDIRALVNSGTVDPTWQLKLFKNDGTSVSTNITCYYGIPHRMPTADELQWAKPGYVLKGWGATSNATVVAFLPDAPITNSTARSVTKTYYALWTLANEQHTLTCDPMGGTFQTTKYTVVVGKSTYSALGVPTRRGFKFLGWYNEEEDGLQVFDASGKAVKGTAYWDAKGNWIYEADVTVYARWSVDPNAYLIRFHKCDGTGVTREVGFVYGTSTALPTCANGLGWKSDKGLFKGWATSLENAVRGIVWQKDGAAVSTAAAKGKTMDVYAVWETPMIRFVAGGGSGSMVPLYMGVNEVRKLPKCTFTPPAGKKAFAGWACSNKRRYDDEMLVFNLGSVTMTAIWK